jgi:hypothetical protein
MKMRSPQTAAFISRRAVELFMFVYPVTVQLRAAADGDSAFYYVDVHQFLLVCSGCLVSALFLTWLLE